MNPFWTTVLVLAALAAAPSARADDGACLFDGTCAAAPALVATEPGSPAVEAVDGGLKPPSRRSGLEKGASEGALFGFYAGIEPAAKLVDEGYGRRMSRAYDGASADNDRGEAYYYGGMILAAVLYIPALVLGGIGGLVGGAAGAAAPESAERWDAERWWTDGPRR